MPDHEVGITDLLVPRRAELTERVAWFVRLRWLAVGGMLLAVPVGKKLLGFEKIDGQRILALAGALFVLNCSYVLISRALHRPRDGGSPDLRKVELFAKAQVLLDLLILTAILHYSGGIRNPFSFYYIFHVIISSILLSRRSAYGVAALCLGLFGGMALLEHFGVLSAHPLNALQQKPSAGYVLTAIIAMGTTLFTAIFMATSIMQRLKQKEDELEKAWREVKQLEATKSRFLVLVSHEMRSPIVAIRSMLDALGVAYSKCLGEKAVEMLSRASERADSLLTLTKDLLTLARQQSMQEHHAEQEIVDLAALTRNGILLFKAEADEKSIVLKESYPEKAIGVRTDHDSMNLVLSNLISNAIRYTPAGGQVGVSWQLEGRRAMLKVSDTGIGIPESELPHMFKEFFRAENARKFTASGTGLGLAITKNIVERLGGTIAVDSRLNEGSTFTVMLPLA